MLSETVRIFFYIPFLCNRYWCWWHVCYRAILEQPVPRCSENSWNTRKHGTCFTTRCKFLDLVTHYYRCFRAYCWFIGWILYIYTVCKYPQFKRRRLNGQFFTFVYQDGIAGVTVKCDQTHTRKPQSRFILSHSLCFVLFVAFEILRLDDSNLLSRLSVNETKCICWFISWY